MRDFNAFVREHLAPLALPRQREITIVEELAAQLEDSYDSLVASGLSDEHAWAQIQQQIPHLQTLGDELLDAEPVITRLAQPEPDPRTGARPTPRRFVSGIRELMGLGLFRDLQSSVRLFIKDRGFTATTILTLAVCLGANAAIFAVVYAVLLRPLPVPDADRIVAMGDVYPTITPDDILSNTVPSYFDRRQQVTAFEEQAAFAFWYDSVTFDGVSEEIRGMRATPSLFRVLQVQPALGRAFADEEGELGAERKIILSHGLWQRLYGGDPHVIGRDLRMGWTGVPYTVVGVMPRGFSFFDTGSDGHAREAGDLIQFWIPMTFSVQDRSDDSRTRYGLNHIGRLRDGATIEQVRTQIDALNRVIFERFPQFRFTELGMYTAVTPLQDALTRKVSRLLYLLWGGAACVLFIGALNIVNLSLARSRVRTRELATRLTLGAGAIRLTRQLVLEGVLLAGTGGLAGVAVAVSILDAMAWAGMANVPNAASVRVDWIVAGITMSVSVLVGVVIGLVPVFTLGRRELQGALIEGSRLGTGGLAARAFRRGLVVTQVAGSVVLLIGAVLLLTSFRNLLAVDAGFVADRVMTATIFPPPSRYPNPAAVVALSDRILDEVRRITGVQAAGLTSNIALSGGNRPATVSPADGAADPNAPLVLPSVVTVTPGYFEAMSTPLVRGRYFDARDQADSLAVAIVDERLAARFWPNEDPVGKRIVRGGSMPFTIVGVVREVRFDNLTGQTSIGAAYFPNAQAPPLGRLRWIAVKTAADATSVLPALRAAVKTIDPDLPLSDIQTMSERTAQSVVTQRLAMSLAGMFGVVALFLSVVGIYGVLAYVVTQRTREIGIRMALGSTARGIFRLFFNEGLTLVALGLTVGLAGALIVGRGLEDQVFGIGTTDPFVLGLVACGTGLVALVACLSPARRAMRVEPLTALRHE